MGVTRERVLQIDKEVARGLRKTGKRYGMTFFDLFDGPGLD
jgi:hypothetical protein